MPDKPRRLDAKAATVKVKLYFEDVHGQYSVLGFQVHSVGETEKGWHVVCSFSPGYGTARLKYTIDVDAATGEIGRVEATETA